MSDKNREIIAYCCFLACIILGAVGIFILGKNIIAGEVPTSPKVLFGAALTVLSFCFGACGMSLVDVEKQGASL